MEEEKVCSQRNYQSLQSNIKRIALSPGKPIGRALPRRLVPQQTSLSSNPRTLYDLWEEYTVGLGGRKPAKEYTPTERGKVTYKYTRRKVVWDVITTLTNSGLHSHVAIDRIYDYYGRDKTITQVINLMRKDSANIFVPPPFQLGGSHLYIVTAFAKQPGFFKPTHSHKGINLH